MVDRGGLCGTTRGHVQRATVRQRSVRAINGLRLRSKICVEELKEGRQWFTRGQAEAQGQVGISHWRRSVVVTAVEVDCSQMAAELGRARAEEQAGCRKRERKANGFKRVAVLANSLKRTEEGEWRR